MTVSVWQEMAGNPTTVTHDVAVVGAGMVGSHLAGLLTGAGRDVALIEARYPAAGASGRNAGMVLVGSRDTYSEAIERFGHDKALEIWRLTDENVRLMGEIADGSGVEHEENGASYIARDSAFATRLRESAVMLEQDGFDAEYVDGDPMDRGFQATLLQPGDFGTQPAALSIAMAASSGATLYENDEVFGIKTEGTGLVIRTRGHIVRCEKAVLAVNGYAPLVHPFFRPLVEPSRGQIAVTEPLPRMIDTLALVNEFCYFRQLSDGRLMVGGGRFQNPVEERSHSDETTPNVQGVIERFIAQYFPEADGKIERRWAGIHGMTPDGLPIIGSLPGEPNVYFVVGFSGHGNSMGLIAGERVMDLMLNGQDPGVFNVNRFE